MYICIEGVIGVGKTSLVNILSEQKKFKKILEIVDENPFLSDFYKQKEDLSFQTEMFFLVNRFKQIESFHEENSNEQIVSDYSIYKNILFANQTLNSYELSKFKKIFSILEKDLRKPDLIIFLRADLETIKKRIKKRNRAFETDINENYLIALMDSYELLIQDVKDQGLEYLIIETDDIDFVGNELDKKVILNQFNKKMEEIQNGKRK